MKRFVDHRRRPTRSWLLVLGGLTLLAALAASIGTAATTVAPSNTGLPTVSGNANVGNTLTASRGTWSGTTPLSFAYQWLRCNSTGASCAAIAGADDQTYKLVEADRTNTLRIRVTATNSDGNETAQSVPTAVVAAAGTGGTDTTGCPKTAQSSDAVAAADVSTPARLQITGFELTSGKITAAMRSFSVRIKVGSTCGNPVRGAKVFATAVPYNQVSIPAITETGADGTVTMTFNRLRGFPAIRTQRLMVLFVRASKQGESVLSGISTHRLVSLPVNLRG